MASFLLRNPRRAASSLPRTLLFSTLSSPQNPNPPPTFRSTKSAINAASDPDTLAASFLRSSGVSHSARFLRYRPIFHRAVRRLARWRRPDLIEQVVEHQKLAAAGSPMLRSEGFWIRLVMLYSGAGMVDQAMRTFRQMRDSGCPRTEKSLCAAISVHADNGMGDKVREMFETLPGEIGVSPGVVSYNLVLKSICGEENGLELGRSWLGKMEREDNVEPDIHTYDILLGACLRNGDDVGFDSVVKEISKKGLKYSLGTYNHRIAKYCKIKECVRAKKLLDEMVSNFKAADPKDVKAKKVAVPNSATYNLIIDGFCRVADLESAKKILDRMLSDGIASPNASTYYTLIKHTVYEGEIDLALDMCLKILKKQRVPPFESVRRIVDALVKNSKTHEANELVEKMKKRLKGAAVDSWAKVEAALPL